METKDAAVRDELYEEAQLLRRRQQDYKSELVGLPGDGSSLPVVRTGDIEAVVSAWSGVPVERLTEDEMSKLTRLVSTTDTRWSGFALVVVSSCCSRYCVRPGSVCCGLL
jgi:ATP-dependent Clp protease ATP-binding subunit ClpC